MCFPLHSGAKSREELSTTTTNSPITEQHRKLYIFISFKCRTVTRVTHKTNDCFGFTLVLTLYFTLYTVMPEYVDPCESCLKLVLVPSDFTDPSEDFPASLQNTLQR